MIKVDEQALEAAIEKVVRRVLGGLLQGDRRVAPRLKNGPRKPKKTCPTQGCKNAFAPRFGGYCEKHRETNGFREWQSGKEKTAKKAKPR